MSLLWTPSEHALEENAEWARLRAVEWRAFPAYLSQPLVPVLLAAFHWYAILPVVLVTVCVWRPLRGHLVSFSLASAGMLFVSLLKWPLAGSMAVFFILKGMWAEALVSCLWPLLVTLVCFKLCPDCPEELAVRFLQQMGYSLPEPPWRLP